MLMGKKCGEHRARGINKRRTTSGLELDDGLGGDLMQRRYFIFSGAN